MHAMPCYRPIMAVKVHRTEKRFYTVNGKRKLFFGARASGLVMTFPEHEIVKVPCYNCIGCKKRRSQEWGVRCQSEVQFYNRTCMINLTYNREQLPIASQSGLGTLCPRDLNLFFKKLRVFLQRKKGITDTKYFACGEYGENRGRPHYHAIFYGWDFPSEMNASPPVARMPEKNNPGKEDVPLYSHPDLTRLWGKGAAFFSPNVGGAAAYYVAKYCMKNLSGDAKTKEFEDTGREPPFNRMSHGLGDRYYDRYKADIYPRDYIITEPGGPQLPIPRRFDNLLQKESEEYLEWIKSQRIAKSEKDHKNQTPERMRVREELAEIKAKLYHKRRLDSRLSPEALKAEAEIESARKLLLEQRRKELE